MIADFYTKPLQGKQFKKLSEFIMGIKFDDIEFVSSEERVEEKPKIENEEKPKSDILKTHDSNSTDKNNNDTHEQQKNTKTALSFKEALLSKK